MSVTATVTRESTLHDSAPAPQDAGAEICAEWARGSRRVAVAMWDFSWLVRRSGAESEYNDWGRVLDELVERGYDCVRIDPFPHLLQEASDRGNEPCTILSQPGSFMWGNHAAVAVQPRKALVEFLRALRGRPLGLALSSWFLADTTHQKERINSPQRLAETWLATLRLLEAEGLLERVLWVDLCNEFPMSIWVPGVYQDIFRTRRSYSLMPSALVLGRPWGQGALRRMQQYFEESLGTLRREFPDLRYTFSFQEFGARNLERLDLSMLDLIEAHIWASDDLRWSVASRHYQAALGFANGVQRHAVRAGKIYARHRDRCIRVLSRRLDFWRLLADKHNLPLVTTEGWVSTFYGDSTSDDGTDGWTWFKDLAEAAIELAIDKGWSGICTSNFCQPHFRRHWSDVEWHQRVTTRIKTATVPPPRSDRC